MPAPTRNRSVSSAVPMVGASTQAPEVSNFQPWYTQRRPQSSLRPRNMSAPRWGQRGSTRPTAPRESRKATSDWPMTVTRTGGQSGPGSSSESSTGVQKRRNKSPIGVPAPVRVSRSFSSADSIWPPPCPRCRAALRLPQHRTCPTTGVLGGWASGGATSTTGCAAVQTSTARPAAPAGAVGRPSIAEANGVPHPFSDAPFEIRLGRPRSGGAHHAWPRRHIDQLV